MESAISDLESEGDDEVASSLQSALDRRMQEKQEIQNRAEQIAGQLEQARQIIIGIDQWNEEAVRVISQLSSTEPEAYEAAAQRVSDRRQWVEQQESKVAELKQRLDQISRGAS